MEFKKCKRCGCFFVSDHDVCCNCETKDHADIATLKSYIQDAENITSLESISYQTGIAQKNLNRYFERKEFASFKEQFINSGNIKL